MGRAITRLLTNAEESGSNTVCVNFQEVFDFLKNYLIYLDKIKQVKDNIMRRCALLIMDIIRLDIQRTGTAGYLTVCMRPSRVNV